MLRLIFTVILQAFCVSSTRKFIWNLVLSRSSQCFGSASETTKLQETIYPVLVVARTGDISGLINFLRTTQVREYESSAKLRRDHMTTSPRSKCVIMRTPLKWGSCICLSIVFHCHMIFHDKTQVGLNWKYPISELIKLRFTR